MISFLSYKKWTVLCRMKHKLCVNVHITVRGKTRLWVTTLDLFLPLLLHNLNFTPGWLSMSHKCNASQITSWKFTYRCTWMNRLHKYLQTCLLFKLKLYNNINRKHIMVNTTKQLLLVPLENLRRGLCPLAMLCSDSIDNWIYDLDSWWLTLSHSAERNAEYLLLM